MQVHKFTHSGEQPPEMVTVGVRVKDESPRGTLEVPVVFTWNRPDGPASENRTYTFIQHTRKRSNRVTIQERAIRFVQCPREVAQLFANCEFQAADPAMPGTMKRGRWLDVRYAATREEFEKADSIAPNASLKAEVAKEPPGLLRPKKVVRTDAPAPRAEKIAEPVAPAAPEPSADEDLTRLTNAELTERLVALGANVPPKATKAELIALLTGSARGG